MKKTIKIIMGIIVLIFIVVLGFLARKKLIINSLTKTSESYRESSNYHIVKQEKRSDGTISLITECFRKGNLAKINEKTIYPEGEKNFVIYYNYETGEVDSYYIEEDGTKIKNNSLKEYVKERLIIQGVDENYKQDLFLKRVTSEIYNNIDCYKLSNNSFNTYISKDTGLVVALENKNSIQNDSCNKVEYIVEFNMVSDEQVMKQK